MLNFIIQLRKVFELTLTALDKLTLIIQSQMPLVNNLLVVIVKQHFLNFDGILKIHTFGLFLLQLLIQLYNFIFLDFQLIFQLLNFLHVIALFFMVLFNKLLSLLFEI
jgi:hypothetical protein